MPEYKFDFDTEGYEANLDIKLKPGEVFKIEEKNRYMTKIGDRPSEMKPIEAIVYDVTLNGQSQELTAYRDLIVMLDHDANYIKIEPKTKTSKKEAE